MRAAPPRRGAEPHPGIDANVPALVVGVVAAILVTAGCAAWPGWRATAEGPLAGPSPPPRRSAASRLAAARPVSLGIGLRLALHRGAGRTAVPVRSAIASATVGVAGLCAAIVFAASLSHLLASPALYGVTWDAIASNAAANDVRPIVATIRHDRRVAAWTTCWTGAPLRAGGTAFEAIALPLPGGTPFVPAPAAGRLPRTSQEIALGTKTLRELHARIGTTIGVSLDNSPPRSMTIVGTTVFPSLSDKLGLAPGPRRPPAACVTLCRTRRRSYRQATCSSGSVPASARRPAATRSPLSWRGSDRSR